jgi:hypothetical protein
MSGESQDQLIWTEPERLTLNCGDGSVFTIGPDGMIHAGGPDGVDITDDDTAVAGVLREWFRVVSGQTIRPSMGVDKASIRHENVLLKMQVRALQEQVAELEKRPELVLVDVLDDIGPFGAAELTVQSKFCKVGQSGFCITIKPTKTTEWQFHSATCVAMKSPEGCERAETRATRTVGGDVCISVTRIESARRK